MGLIKVFNNASVVSVQNGRIVLKIKDNGIKAFDNASIVSIVNGIVKISVENVIFTDDMLKPGMVVEYRNGNRRLVLEIKGQLIFCGMDCYREATIKDCFCRDLEVVKIFHPKDQLTLDGLLNNPDNLIWEE